MRGARTTIDLRDLRMASGLMLGAAALAPLLPGPDGLPCPLRSLTGVPCPLCGMTTSVTATLQLRLDDALGANPVGVLLVVLTLVLLVMRPTRLAAPLWLVLAAGVALSWVWELQRFSVI